MGEATCCGVGLLVGTMTQTDGVCAHKTGTNTQCVAADAVRRGAVVITVTYTVDSAVASITLTAVVVSTNTMALDHSLLTMSIAGVIAGAVIGAIVGIAIIAGIAFFVMKKNSNPSPAKVEPFDQKVGVRAQ